MKRLISFLVSLALITACVGMGGADLEQATGLSSLSIACLVVGTGVLLSVLFPAEQMTGVHTAGISKEIWVDYIIKRFWKDNAFLKNFFNDSQYVAANGKTVHIPQPGTKPTVTKNPSSWPLTAAQRTDTEISYDLDFYVSTPSFITDGEAAEISYDKMDSLMGEHMAQLNERIAEELVIKFLSGLTVATNGVATTGSAAAAYSTGLTGNRKLFLPADLKTARLLMNKQNVPKTDRFALLDSNALDQMTTGMTTTEENAFNQYYNSQTGQIGRFAGFDIFERSEVAVSAALSGGVITTNAYGAAVVASTDIATNLCWQKDAAAAALGEVKVYEDLDNPLYAGDIFNGSVRAGGRRRRTGNEGVIAIYQG